MHLLVFLFLCLFVFFFLCLLLSERGHTFVKVGKMKNEMNRKPVFTMRFDRHRHTMSDLDSRQLYVLCVCVCVCVSVLSQEHEQCLQNYSEYLTSLDVSARPG